ncbi:patatin-like phospholipase family protein [Nocardioides sp. AX2bis]|uniref:patatin-like phospholipase family protein n=1 Tax=Nocardioides sp. AX2bis TaxID=2653157 RepID=UPI0012F2B2B0|nr:patatin-like phospholipase family protein [Nocardioides sp. AX2bis]VXA92133.1 conserved hypothetical protein [Nocardioides sp. AX2bis]
MTRRALVLGGGGITGIAWELGLLHGLARAGVDLTDADLVVGTSAGSVVGSLVRCAPAAGTDLAALYASQLEPPEPGPTARMGLSTIARLAPPFLLPGDAERKRARLGRLAMRHPGDGEERVEVLRGIVPWEEWPERALKVTAVEAETGRFTVFDRSAGVNGVPLVRAVSASCAVPLVWPTVVVGDRHYLDGGFRSTANVDLAAGYDDVVVVAPLPRAFSRATSIPAQLARTGCTRSAVVVPDAQALTDIGRNVLDFAHRADAARTGLRQAADVVERVGAAWG